MKLRPLSEEDLESILVREGAALDAARRAAQAANGNLRRARVLVRDVDLARRIAHWRSVPERLTGTLAASAVGLLVLGDSTRAGFVVPSALGFVITLASALFLALNDDPDAAPVAQIAPRAAVPDH